MNESSKQDSLTGLLKAMVVGGAMLLGASSAQASLSSKPAAAPKPDSDADEPLDSRVDRVRQKLSETDAKSDQPADLPKDSAPLDEAQKMWWRNWGNWHNGGWPNWRNGWGNAWHNGGGGWRNGRRWWANF